MRDSIFEASMVKSVGVMSQKTGVSPHLAMAWVVEAKVNGVVMTSPVKFIACRASSMDRWPLAISSTCLASK